MAKDKKAKKEKKETFIKGVRKEMKNVNWPSKKDVLKYSLTTIGLVIFFVVFFVAVDLVSAFVKGLFV